MLILEFSEYSYMVCNKPKGIYCKHLQSLCLYFHNKSVCALSTQTGSPSRQIISLVSDGLDEDLLKLKLPLHSFFWLDSRRNEVRSCCNKGVGVRGSESVSCFLRNGTNKLISRDLAAFSPRVLNCNKTYWLLIHEWLIFYIPNVDVLFSL